MSHPSKAVFISYAREDAVLAGKVARQFQDAGLEVWFDQEELKGGDTWDLDIRRQIQECALFVPLISAHTNRRLEGYFRLEWRLAVERTHTMADGVPFIFPLMVDTMKEDEALVPADFKKFQWTRVGPEGPTSAVTQRVTQLLSSPPVPRYLGANGRTTPSRGVHKKTLLTAVVGGLILITAISLWQREPVVESPLVEPGLAADDKSIAVLPFKNLDADDANAYFASGLHEDVLVQLSRIGELQVVAKSVVARYVSGAADPADIGADLAVRFVLEGSVRRSDRAVRVTLQLVDTARSRTVWAEDYDRTLDNIFALQSEISREVARSLQAKISPAVAAAIDRLPTESPLAYDALLKAREQVGSGFWVPFDSLSRAEERLRFALELDPEFVDAWALLAIVNSRRANQLWSIEEDSSDLLAAKAAATEALNQAQQLSPGALVTLQAEGVYNIMVARDFITAIRALDQALRLVPNDAESLTILGYGYRFTGRVDEAIATFERIRKLDPTNGFAFNMLVNTHRDAGHYEELIPLYEKVFERNPEMGHFKLEALYYRFLVEGSLAAFHAYEEALGTVAMTDRCDPSVWRQGRMTLAMLSQDFDAYAKDWHAEWESHHFGHGDWVCPLQTNDEANHAAIMLKLGDSRQIDEILDKADFQITMPINPMAQCAFNPAVIKPKLMFLRGDQQDARIELEAALERLSGQRPFYVKYIEKAVLLEAADLVAPDLAYQIYRDIQNDPMRLATFESICANPWSYPNLISDPNFRAEIERDGRFVDFLRFFEII